MPDTQEIRSWRLPYTAEQIQTAIGKSPRPDERTKTWWLWDISRMAYYDTGVPSSEKGDKGEGLSEEDADKLYLKLSGGQVNGYITVNESGGASIIDGSSIQIIALGKDGTLVLRPDTIEFVDAQGKIKGLSDPVESDEAATKKYADEKVSKDGDSVAWLRVGDETEDKERKIFINSTDGVRVTRKNDKGELQQAGVWGDQIFVASDLTTDQEQTAGLHPGYIAAKSLTGRFSLHAYERGASFRGSTSGLGNVRLADAIEDDEATTLGQVRLLIDKSGIDTPMTNEEIDEIMQILKEV